MSDIQYVYDKSLTPYPRDSSGVGYESDSNPSEEIMISDSDNDDSSIEVLPSPLVPPPEIVDIANEVDSTPIVAPVAVFAPVVQTPVESEGSVSVSLTEITPVIPLYAPIWTLSSAYVPPEPREGAVVVTELVSHFHPATVEPETQTVEMPTSDRYRFEIPSHVRTEPIAESQLSLVGTERLVGSAPPRPHVPLSVVFTAPALLEKPQ